MVYFILIFVGLIAYAYYSRQLKDLKRKIVPITNSKSLEVFNLAEKGVVSLEQEYMAMSEKTKFNVMIFNVMFILLLLKESKTSDYNEVESSCIQSLENYGMRDILFRKSDDVKAYINSMNKIYFNELNKLNDPLYVPFPLFNAFYDKPNADIFEVSMWKRHLISMINQINDNIKNLI